MAGIAGKSGRPKNEIQTVQLSFRLREDEAALLRDACERLGVPPGRLLGRIIRAAFEPATGDPGLVSLDELRGRQILSTDKP